MMLQSIQGVRCPRGFSHAGAESSLRAQIHLAMNLQETTPCRLVMQDRRRIATVVCKAIKIISFTSYFCEARPS